MKGKLILTLGFSGALALSIGFAKDLQSTEVFAQDGQPKEEDEQTSTNNGDQYRFVTREEQDRREGMVAEGKDVTTVITAEEQNMVENSSAQQGFVPQENGTGFYFVKENNNKFSY
ncbi:hypothetical protein J2Y73_001972 [Peribacillus frigoritolerans]|uniref:hypothetical protein n=1 Tax=Peribacillus frigoritolerans TaxID=450367 RepID=UPI00209DD678|nr:hypothetical protein [Peribacillus frigoritolerans]MCP1491941.1 hypothetical protein [Peribacillus frigoritolerans]